MNHSFDIALSASFLFNQDFYLKNHTVRSLSFFDREIEPTLLCSFVETSTGNFVSGYRAPFGGIECTDISQLDSFILYIKEIFKSLGAASITIRQAPACYQHDVSIRIFEVFAKHGFTLNYSDVNQHIRVDPSVPFHSCIDDQKRRRLNTLKSKGARLEIADHIDSDQWYELYVKSRVHKNFPVTISKEEYIHLSVKLPDTYQYAGVFIDGRLVANAIFVRVNSDVLYYFLAASDPEYASLSPSVFVVEAMYEYAQKLQYSVLDLGISSVNGVINEGLHFFKKSLGAIDSQKNTYELIY